MICMIDIGDKYFTCDEVGGYCEDAFNDKRRFVKKGARKTGRAYRRKQNIRKRNRRMQIIMAGQSCRRVSLKFWQSLTYQERK